MNNDNIIKNKIRHNIPLWSQGYHILGTRRTFW